MQVDLIFYNKREENIILDPDINFSKTYEDKRACDMTDTIVR